MLMTSTKVGSIPWQPSVVLKVFLYEYDIMKFDPIKDETQPVLQ